MIAGQTPTKKYHECKNCGAPTPEPQWNTSKGEWQHNSQCVACKNFKRRHGFVLTHADREFLGEPKCAICGTTEGTLCIDHDHKTNAVRGWLCHLHNAGIGHFEDNIEDLEKAIQYLKNAKQINGRTGIQEIHLQENTPGQRAAQQAQSWQEKV